MEIGVLQQKVNNKMSLKDFVILEKLGQGSYASVYKVKRLNDNNIYALKQIKMNKLDEKSKKNALNQIRFLASFDCPTIITYHEAFIEESQGLLCIVMEYADGGDLMKMIKGKSKEGVKIPEIQIWKLMINLLRGTEYLHNRSILHRDIKPENIFICNGVYKLGDLNVSKIKCQDQKQTQTGTPYYASPEVWNDLPYDQKTDIWSIGCALYEMASYRPPFVSSNLESLFHEVTKSKQKPIPKNYSNELSSIINNCLEKNPKKRSTIAQFFQNWTIKMYLNICTNEEDIKEQKKIQLLKTINFPSNRQIKEIELPKSNYKNEKEILTFRQPVSPIRSKKEENKENYESYDSTPLLIQTEVLKQTPYNKLVNNISYVKSEVKLQKHHKKMSVVHTQQTPVKNERTPKRRSSPRTELSKSKKYGAQSEQNLAPQKVRPFIFGSKKQLPEDSHKLIENKLCKGMKKNILMEQLIRNQQKAFKNLLEKSKPQRESIFSSKSNVQHRVLNVLSAVRH